MVYMYQQEKDMLMDGSMTERENNGNSWAGDPPSVSDSNFLPEPPGAFKFQSVLHSDIAMQSSRRVLPPLVSLALSAAVKLPQLL